MDIAEWVAEKTIHRILGGSHLYGTNRPDSDKDVRGVCLMPPTAVFGLTPFEQYQSHAGEDVEIYGVTKFFRLALEGNPNILDILFCPPDRWEIAHGWWEPIYERRHWFLSQRVRRTFMGYAAAQLKQLRGRRAWLLRPPDHQPEPQEYGCWLVADAQGGQELCAQFPAERQQYLAAKLHWENYQRWLRERNPRRAALEQVVGYDVKNAAHLVRLLYKGAAVLAAGDYSPPLVGAELAHVQAVLAGDLAYEDLITWATEQERRVQAQKSSLPVEPNFVRVERLLMWLNGWVTYGNGVPLTLAQV